MSPQPPDRSQATRAAVLTGEGLGAVAVVRVWGPNALAIVDAGFRPVRPARLDATPSGRPRLGRFGAGIGDEVVVIVQEGSLPEVEIQCHGGSAAIGLVMEGLIASGVEPSGWTDWTSHAAGSTIQAEALVDLAHAETTRTASHLLDQSKGTLERELATILDLIQRQLPEAIEPIDALLDSASVGLRLIRGWCVVLAGRPNVGKSRLLNALIGFDRAIVDPTPGTTRDLVSSRTALDGWPVEITDTAGLRETTDPIEAAGVALARTQHSESDLLLVVLDRSVALTDEDRRLIEGHPDALIVANKSDLAPAWNHLGLSVSAQRGDGIAELVAEVGRRIVPHPPIGGQALLFRADHERRLRSLRHLVERSRFEEAAQELQHWTERPGGPNVE